MKGTVIVFVAIVSCSRHEGKVLKNDASAVASYGIPKESHLVVATRLFPEPGSAQLYAVEVQKRLDLEMNAEVDHGTELDFSRYEALIAVVQPSVATV